MAQFYNYLEKSLQQFEGNPYPETPIETSLKEDVGLLYINSLVTPYYRRDHRIINSFSDYSILDVACGTGRTTLALAEANPGAKIVAVDISPGSLEIAKGRLNHHGFKDVDYHVIALEDIAELGLKFDYINASDVLYLLPDIGLALQHMTKALKPEGIIRSNLHSYYQRINIYRSQKLFKRMGLMEENPGKIEIGLVREFFVNLKDNLPLKMTAWGNRTAEQVSDQEVLMNYLFLNDKGFTMPQLLTFLGEAGLELVDMVDWWAWQIEDLFKDPDDLPAFLAMGLEDLPKEEQFCLYELINPNKRLLDFWCGFPQAPTPMPPVSGPITRIALHPQFQTPSFREEILSRANLGPANLKQYIPILKDDYWLDRAFIAAVFTPLLDQPCSLSFLAQRYHQARPVNPQTLEPVTEAESMEVVQEALLYQEQMGFILLEQG
jgi:ubiquinone/menaquinone biosynthesis C-methylase UbiE